MAYDVGATALVGFKPGEPIGDLLRVLGMDFQAEPTSSYRVHLPDRTLDIVADSGEFERAAVAAFCPSAGPSAVGHRIFWRFSRPLAGRYLMRRHRFPECHHARSAT